MKSPRNLIYVIGNTIYVKPGKSHDSSICQVQASIIQWLEETCVCGRFDAVGEFSSVQPRVLSIFLLVNTRHYLPYLSVRRSFLRTVWYNGSTHNSTFSELKFSSHAPHNIEAESRWTFVIRFSSLARSLHYFSLIFLFRVKHFSHHVCYVIWDLRFRLSLGVESSQFMIRWFELTVYLSVLLSSCSLFHSPKWQPASQQSRYHEIRVNCFSCVW